MGRIRASFSHFLDVASEEVACSSGVLLSDANIRRLAGRYHISELRGITRSSGETVLRAEELEEAILNLRVAIGELPDNKMGQFFFVDAAKMIWASGGNPRKLAAAFRRAPARVNVQPPRHPSLRQHRNSCKPACARRCGSNRTCGRRWR